MLYVLNVELGIRTHLRFNISAVCGSWPAKPNKYEEPEEPASCIATRVTSNAWGREWMACSCRLAQWDVGRAVFRFPSDWTEWSRCFHQDLPSKQVNPATGQITWPDHDQLLPKQSLGRDKETHITRRHSQSRFTWYKLRQDQEKKSLISQAVARSS